MSKHIFSLYYHALHNVISEKEFAFKDPELWTRLIKVLRLRPNEEFILFNKTHNALLRTSSDILLNKRIVCGTVEKVESNKPTTSTITLYLPILKKEAFEDALYVAAEVGVQAIVPVITEKSQSDIGEKEKARLEKIIIAACEQAKNFFIPELLSPILLSSIIFDGTKIGFCEDGAPVETLIPSLKTSPLAVILGPEAGFTDNEKTILLQNGFCFYKLTPTILRSRDAVTIGLGLIRSFTA